MGIDRPRNGVAVPHDVVDDVGPLHALDLLQAALLRRVGARCRHSKHLSFAGTFAGTQRWRKLRPTIPQLAAEEVQELVNPLGPHEMLREQVDGVVLAANFTKLEGAVTNSVLYPQALSVYVT